MIGDPWTPPSALFMLMLVPNIPDLIGLEPPITPVGEESIFKTFNLAFHLTPDGP